MNKQTEALKMAIAEARATMSGMKHGWELGYKNALGLKADSLGKSYSDYSDEFTSAITNLQKQISDGLKELDACKKAEQLARLVSYAPDKSTCTLNIDGEEVYFNREQPAQEHCVNLKMDKCEHKNICKHCEQPAQEPVDMRPAVYGAWKEPAQEPVALKFPTMLRKMWSGTEVQEWLDKQQPLYTHPAPAREPLSDEDFRRIIHEQGINLPDDYAGICQAVERAHWIGREG